jgi:putative SOS response-associated peptidase YedK
MQQLLPVVTDVRNTYLSRVSAPVNEVVSMVSPYRPEEMQAWQVSRRVSKTQDDDAGLIEAEG